MNRREFFRIAGLGVAGLVVAQAIPEALAAKPAGTQYFYGRIRIDGPTLRGARGGAFAKAITTELRGMAQDMARVVAQQQRYFQPTHSGWLRHGGSSLWVRDPNYDAYHAIYYLYGVPGVAPITKEAIIQPIEQSLPRLLWEAVPRG